MRITLAELKLVHEILKTDLEKIQTDEKSDWPRTIPEKLTKAFEMINQKIVDAENE